jgi:hypothetical protein
MVQLSSIQEALNVRADDGLGELRSAQETMVSGALRMAAGRLLGQATQARHGEKELMSGFYDLEEWRAENRRKYAAESKAQNKTLGKKRGSVRDV